VFHDWWTDVDLAADAGGAATVRAFKGQHNVSGSFGGLTTTVGTTLTTGGKSLGLALPFVLGDYNRNGIVDAADYTVWRDSFGRTVAIGVGADGNGNGVIDSGDYQVWKLYFGSKLTAGSASAPANIPEPSSLRLVLIAGAICLRIAASRFNDKARTPELPEIDSH
jgi:hypothetical protein